MHEWLKFLTRDGDGQAHWVLWALPLLAVPAVPALVWMAAERPMAARIPLAAGMAFGVALVELVIFAAVSRGFRHRLRSAAAITASVTLMLFMWPQLTFVGNDVSNALPFSFPPDPVPVAIAGIMIWLSIRIGNETVFAVTLSLGTWAAVVALAVATLPYLETSPTVARAESAPPDAPDVLLLVLDGYGRTDKWQEILGFDNSPFERDLEEVGFTVASEARANYGVTFAALSAMYNLDYLFEVGPITQDDYTAMRTTLTGNGLMMQQFRSAGYEVAYVENSWQGSNCGPGVDRCFRDGLSKRVMWNLGQISIFAPLAEATQIHPFNTVSTQHLDSLAEYLEADRTDGIPRLMLAHVILPHPPFHLDPSCDRINSSDRVGFRSKDEEAIELRKGFLRDQTLCTNSMVLDELEEILEKREDTLIMITGDHGSETMLLENVEGDAWDDDAILSERMAIFSAYRLPGCEDRLYPSMSPVNGTRALTSCALGIDLLQIEDRTLWTPDFGVDVTDISARIEP